MSLYATDSNGKLHKIAGNGIGDTIVVDAQLDTESTNPVQNKVITNALNDYYTKNEVNELIDNIPETDLSNYYNKSEVDTLIDNIPETDLSEYYTKSETDNQINNNVNVQFAESERQKSETDGEIVHKNELDTTNVNLDSFSRGYNNFRNLTFDSWDSIKDWVQNEAPVGSYIKYISLSGFWTLIIQKTSSQYASIVRFWYENNKIQKCKLYAGNWSDFEDV